MTKTFRADIQGLRAIAVASVVLFHAFADAAPGGFVGVDIFFVISGYLISQIILKDLSRGEFSLRKFYVRRIRRIFPALYAMIAAALALGWLLLSPTDLRELAQTVFATTFFVSNFDFIHLSGYFDGSGDLKPLLHTWSLAVEEQFYIVYPLALAFLARRFPALLRPVLVAAAIASLGLSLWLTGADPTLAFYLAPTRAFELLVGGFLAMDWAPPRSRIQRDAESVLGLVAILAALALFTRQTPFPGYAALLPCAGAALLIHAGQGGLSAGGRLIGLAPFRFFGDLSYSLYLWHWPLLVFGRHYCLNEMTGRQVAAIVALSVLLAVLSFRFVERPFLAGRSRETRVFVAGGGAMAIASAVALAIFVAHGLPGRFPPASLALFDAADDYNHDRSRCHSGADHLIPYEQDCVYGDRTVDPDVAIWGDSHGAELSVALGEAAAPLRRSLLEVTSSRCPPAFDYNPSERPDCSRQTRETFDKIVADKRLKTIIIAVDFEAYGSDHWESFSSGYRRLIDGLVSSHKRIVLLDQIPLMNYDPPVALGLKERRREAWADYGVSRRQYEDGARMALQLVSEVSRESGADHIVAADTLCDSQICHAYGAQAGVLYFNDSHLSVAGARLLATSMTIW